MADSILSTVIVTLLVGGSSPWWYAAIKSKTGSGKKADDDSPVQTQSVVKVAEAPLVASQDFFLGRWRVEQVIGSLSGANHTDYYKDGTFDGEVIRVDGNQGQKVGFTGTWELIPVSDRIFHLEYHETGDDPKTMKFKILDRDHIQNMDENYIAERVE